MPAIISIATQRTCCAKSRGATTLEQAEAAGNAFRAWTEAEGLLLVPPEDGKRA